MEGRLEVPVELPDTPYGYCQCGCGEKTRLATKTVTSAGIVKGQPMQFIDRHQNRVVSFGRRHAAGPDWVAEGCGYATPCWVWQRCTDRHGYGKTSITFNGEKYGLAHRLSYALQRGPIATGMTLDHLCRNPSCVRPDHLEAVDLQTNNGRSRKATPAQTVAEVRALVLAGYRVDSIVTAYGLGHHTLAYNFANRTSRAAVPDYTGDVDALAAQHGLAKNTHYNARHR